MEESATPAVTTRSVGVKYGLISAAVSIVMFLGLALSGMNPFDNTMNWIGAAISILIIVLAHREFKANGDGFMSYGQGFNIGFWMLLVGIVVGGGFTYIYTNFIDTSVMENFYRLQAEKMQEQGMPDEQIEVAQEWTRKLFWVFYVVFGFIFGLIIPAIVSIFTQKKNPQADTI